MIVDIFIPCYIDQFYPETAFNMVKVLERLGCGVNYNVEQTCCGRPAFEDGYWDACKEIGEKLIKEFQDERYIVSPGPACVSTIKNHYPSLFHNSALHNEYKIVQKKMYEFSDFLVNVLNASDCGATFETDAVYLDSCCSTHELEIKDAPRILLSKVRNLNLIDLPTTLPCCGINGGIDRKNEELTLKMAHETLRIIEQSNANTIISNDYQCLMHLNGVIQKENRNLKVIHLADVLANGW